jgi:hypothetical protein
MNVGVKVRRKRQKTKDLKIMMSTVHRRKRKNKIGKTREFALVIGGLLISTSLVGCMNPDEANSKELTANDVSSEIAIKQEDKNLPVDDVTRNFESTQIQSTV